jgi:photoactive yellow protein
MPDQDPNQDPSDRSILGSDEPTDGNVSEESSPSTESPDADEASSRAEASHAESAPAPAEEGRAVEDLHFEDENLGEKLRHASDEQLDGAPFGIIKVDDEGEVAFFNQYESELSGMDPEDVVGRNFFTQVAPCTNNRLFRGRFKKGVRRGELDETFTYTYTYKMRPTLVDVHLYRDEAGNNWITVQKY